MSGRPQHALLRAVCGPGGDPADCRVLQARARLTGPGPALLSVLPVLLQLVLAEGLRRGRRAAWVAAVAFGAVLTVVGGVVVVTVLRTPADELPDARRAAGQPAGGVGGRPAGGAARGAGAAAAHPRPSSGCGPRPERRAGGCSTGGAGLLAVAARATSGRLADERGSSPAARPPLACSPTCPTRMLPPGYLGEVLAPLVPLHAGARLLADWAGVAAWAVLLVTAVRLCCARRRPPGDAAPGPRASSTGTATGRCRS